jgi:adhesin/invasin
MGRGQGAKHRSTRLWIARLFTLSAALLCALMLAAVGTARASGTGTLLTVSPVWVSVGGQTVALTAEVTDASGQPVPGDSVTFSSDGGQSIVQPSAPTDQNGDVTATLTSSNLAGTSNITATDATSAGLTGTAVLTQTAGPAASMGPLSLSSSLISDNGGTTTATVSVADQYGNPVPGDVISFTGLQPVPNVMTDSTGTASAQLTANPGAEGQQTLTATDLNSTSVTASAQLTQYGAPAAIALSRPPTLTAGQSLSATATVTDSAGDPVPVDPSLVLSWGGGSTAMAPGSPPGTYTATSSPLTAAGTYQVTAADGIATPASGQVTVVAGPVAQLSLGLSSTLVAANGGTSTATVTATDHYGNPVPGDVVQLSGPGVAGASVTTGPTGTATALLSANGTPGQSQLTAADATSTASATLTEYGTPATIAAQLSPNPLTAGQTASITATVTDAQGDPVPVDPGLAASWNGSSAALSPGPSPGTYTGTTPALTAAGTDTVTVSDTAGATPSSATVSVLPGPRAALTLLGGFVPLSIPADHNSTASVQVKVADAYGNGIAGQTLSVSSSDSGQGVTWTDNGGGIYTITVRSSYTPLSSVVSIADGAQSAQAALGQTSAATGIGLSLGAGTLTADGRSHTLATITLHNQYGAPLPGDARNLRLIPSDPHLGIGQITDLGNGDYTAAVTSSVDAHLVSLTASENAMHLKASTGLTLVPGAPAELSVHVAPGVLIANGLATAALTLTLADVHGNPIAGAVPQLRATPAGLHFGRLSDLGGGRYASTVRASNVPGPITVSARDGAAVGAATLTEMTAPSELATASMQWSFHFTRSYTAIIALNLTGAPVGSKIIEICRGRGGCPFRRRVAARVRPVHCTKARHGACHNLARGVNIVHGLRLRQLRPGTVLIVQIVRRGWIGKYYAFAFRGGQAPQITISCLAPGGSRPGAGCQS